ncbi:MAG: phytanoyl-CoA dioxygenase family protein [Bacteroidia bacterium]
MKIIQLLRGTGKYYKWRLRNWASVRAYRSWKKGEPPFKFDSIVEELKANGICQIHIHDLEGGEKLLQDLQEEYNKALEPHRERINENRRKLDSSQKDDSTKEYIIGFNTQEDHFSLDSALMRFALHPEILAVANGYLDMLSKVTGLKFWYTIASKGQEPSGSQLWHRDYDDIKYLKAFVYLGDVGEGAGPFIYAKGSNTGIKRWLDPLYHRERSGGKRATDERMDKFLSMDKWKLATGKEGAIIFADVAGLHKGGHALAQDRKLLYVGYLSAKPEKNRRNPTFTGYRDQLSASANYAIIV